MRSSGDWLARPTACVKALDWEHMQGLRIPDPQAALSVFVAPRGLAVRVPEQMLSAEEMARCTRLRRPEDRERFLAAHGLKRRILGDLLNAPPEALRFACGEDGKPRLEPLDLHFNLSHSGNWVALAISMQFAVGVDVERADRVRLEELRSRIEHPDEHLLPAPDSTGAGLLTRWTLKEAITKASGRGLRQPFQQLRLEPQGAGVYSCRSDGDRWYAAHQLLDDGTHLAFACQRPWRGLWLFRVFSSASDSHGSSAGCEEGRSPRAGERLDVAGGS